MTSRPLSEDTLGDKVVRFVIGAALGAGAAWVSELYTAAEYAKHLGLWALAGGVACAVLGYRFTRFFSR